MDFTWSNDQLSFKDRILTFTQRELNEDLCARDRSGSFSRELWEKCAAFGVQGMAVPEPYAQGEEKDILTSMLAMEALGYGCRDNGLAFALNAQMWTVQLPILHHGTEEQKQEFLPKLCNGSWIGCHAITEIDSGSDVFSMSMLAEKRDGGYVLNGTKCYITCGPIADLALVFATTDRSLGRWGVTAFLVERTRKGYHAGRVRDKMGLRTTPMGDITLTDCFVPESNRLGPEGAGFSISNSSLEYERCCILASQLGAMEYQLVKAVDYARERQQFGKPIGKFQSVANRLVDMKLRLETARLLLYKVTWLKQQDRPAMMEAALLKLLLSESFLSSSIDAVRTHGALGYLTESGVERDLRDAMGGVLYAGTSDIQRNIIARLMGL